jgi:hypothetical protein
MAHNMLEHKCCVKRAMLLAALVVSRKNLIPYWQPLLPAVEASCVNAFMLSILGISCMQYYAVVIRQIAATNNHHACRSAEQQSHCTAAVQHLHWLHSQRETCRVPPEGLSVCACHLQDASSHAVAGPCCLLHLLLCL